jgi:hypothetical protein
MYATSIRKPKGLNNIVKIGKGHNFILCVPVKYLLRAWWRLFQKHIVYAKIDIFVFIDFPIFWLWTCLMKVIPEMLRVH